MLILCRGMVPDLELVDKRTIWWMRWLGRLLEPVVPEFSSRYTTVMGSRVFLPAGPDEMHPNVLASTLAHELVHQLDQKRWGVVFYFSYGFMFPVGRSMRAYWERKAYAVDLLVAHERGGEDEVRRVANMLAEVFSGHSYLWMWAGKMSAGAYLQPVVDAVLDGSLEQQEPYRAIMQAWRGPNALTPGLHLA